MASSWNVTTWNGAEGRAGISGGAIVGGHFGNAESFTVYFASPSIPPIPLLSSACTSFLSGVYLTECWSRRLGN